MSLPPSSAPTATGWSDSCRAGFAPAEEWRLVTAPQKTRLSDVVTDLDNHLSGGLHRPEGQSRLILLDFDEGATEFLGCSTAALGHQGLNVKILWSPLHGIGASNGCGSPKMNPYSPSNHSLS